MMSKIHNKKAVRPFFANSGKSGHTNYKNKKGKE